MTTPVATPAEAYTVAGTGPYAIGFAYGQGEILATVINAGVRTDLTEGVDFTVSPLETETTGNLTLIGGAEVTHAGAQMIIDRDTAAQQGWVGTQGEREKGIERQLDTITRALQDLAARLLRCVRGFVADEPLVPNANGLIGFDDLGNLVVRTDLPDIAQAVIDAEAARTAAEAAEVAGAAHLAATQALSVEFSSVQHLYNPSPSTTKFIAFIEGAADDPKIFRTRFTCTAADGSFAVGDHVDFMGSVIGTGNAGLSVYRDDSTGAWYSRVGTGGLPPVIGTAGVAQTLDLTKWDMTLTAYMGYGPEV